MLTAKIHLKRISTIMALLLVMTLVLSLGPTSTIAKAQSSTEGQPLSVQQQAIREGQDSISEKISANEYGNLAQYITDEANLMEANGVKFGGLSFSVFTDDEVTNYQLTGDVLTKTTKKYTQPQQDYITSDASDVQSDSDQALPLNNSTSDIISQEKINLNATNTTKFSTLSSGLINELSKIPLKNSSNNTSENSGKALASTATAYDGDQHVSYLSFVTSIGYFGTGYHDVTITSRNVWTGVSGLDADPGSRDGMDVEWNPNQLYMQSVVWQPDTQTIAGSFGWSGRHDIAIDQSTQHRGSTGGYYVEPDHNSKTNYVEVYLYPISSSVYGQHGNYYGNYIHTWNYVSSGTITFSLAYGAFSISASPALTGDYKVNNWGTYTI